MGKALDQAVFERSDHQVTGGILDLIVYSLA
jgi:hypothetical protein